MSNSSAQKKRKSMSSVGMSSAAMGGGSPSKGSSSGSVTLSAEEQRKRARLWMEEQRQAAMAANGDGAEASSAPRAKTPTKSKTPSSRMPSVPTDDAPLSVAEQRQRAREWYENRKEGQTDELVLATPAPVVTGSKRKDTPVDIPTSAPGRATRRKSVGPGVTPGVSRENMAQDETESQKGDDGEVVEVAAKVAKRSSGGRGGRKSLKPVVEEEEGDEEDGLAAVPPSLRPSSGIMPPVVPLSENSVFKAAGRRASLDSAVGLSAPRTSGRAKALPESPFVSISNGTAERKRLSLDGAPGKIPAPFSSPDLFASMLEASIMKSKGGASRTSIAVASPADSTVRRTTIQEPPSTRSVYDEKMYLHPSSLLSPGPHGTPVLEESPDITLNLPAEEDEESPPRRRSSVSRVSSTTAVSVKEQRRRAAEWAADNGISVGSRSEQPVGRRSTGRAPAIRAVEASPIVIATPTPEHFTEESSSVVGGTSSTLSRAAQQQLDEPPPSYALVTVVRLGVVVLAFGIWYYQYAQNSTGLMSDFKTSVVTAYHSGYKFTLKSVRTGIFCTLVAALVAPIVFGIVKLVLWALDNSRRNSILVEKFALEAKFLLLNKHEGGPYPIQFLMEEVADKFFSPKGSAKAEYQPGNGIDPALLEGMNRSSFRKLWASVVTEVQTDARIDPVNSTVEGRLLPSWRMAGVGGVARTTHLRDDFGCDALHSKSAFAPAKIEGRGVSFL